eukprot:2758368-Alexandrium_andersonii.AAC.1
MARRVKTACERAPTGLHNPCSALHHARHAQADPHTLRAFLQAARRCVVRKSEGCTACRGALAR